VKRLIIGIMLYAVLDGCYYTPDCQPMIGRYKMVYTLIEGNCVTIEDRTISFPPKYRGEDCFSEWSDNYQECVAVIHYGCPYPGDLGSWEWSGVFTNTQWSDTADGEFTARWFDLQGVVKEICKYTVRLERINDI